MTLDVPRVTVCVPVRNGARTINRTLDSILAQDYPNYEIIVSDNCSTDDTAKIVQDYTARGVRYYLNPQMNTYGESNWNHILSLAAGPLIALYHADDIYTPTMVRRQVEFLEIHPETSAVFTMSQTIDEQDRPIRMGNLRLPKELQGQDCFDFTKYFNAVLQFCTFTPVPTMMTRRQVLDAVGVFNWQMFVSAADVDLYLRMAKKWGPIGVIDEPLHKYRISRGQGSAVIARNRTELPDFHRVMAAHLGDSEEMKIVQPPSLAFYELCRSYDQVVCATNLLAQGKAVEARGYLRAALHWRHFMTAFKRPRMFAWLLVASVFLASSYLGLGTFAGRQMSRARERRHAWRRMPGA